MILLSVHHAAALLEYQTPLELYNNHELIVIGKVISLTEISKRETIYNIKVDEYLKNPKPYDLIDAYGLGTRNNGIWSEDDTIFGIGDRVLLYLYLGDDKYKISPYSFIAPKSCEKHQLLDLPIIPGEPDRGFVPASNPIYLTSPYENETATKGSSSEGDLVLKNKEIRINYDAWNNHRGNMDFDIEITITREDDTTPIFHRKHTLYNLEPCSGPLTESWNFTPAETGKYNVTVIFEGIATSYDFAVRANLVGGSMSPDRTVYPDPFTSSPLKQFKSGTLTENIYCRNNLLLIAKSHDDSPACVKPFSMLRLLETGWGYIPSAFETKTDLLDTTIISGKIIGFKFDVEAASIVINLETTRDGNLTLTIPNALTSSMSWYKNNPSHGVLIDGQFLELNETITARGATVTIPFKQGAKTIEIFGSHEHSVANCPVDESLDLIPVRFDQFGNPQRLVFFVESNSTAQICVRYTSGLNNEGNLPVGEQLVIDYFDTQKSHISSEVTVAAEPSSVPLEIGSETFVLYTITAPSNSDGVYWLPQSQMCDAIPIVVWSHLPQVDSSKLPALMGFHSCPAQMLSAQVVGFSGAIMNYKPANPIGNQD